jgi:hypothetical protein
MPRVQQSEEQHRKSRTLVAIATADPQFTADLFDKRPNNPHPQSFAAGGIKSLWQTGAVIGDRQQVAFLRIGFQIERDPAGAIFGCVRDQFVGDEAQRNGGCGWQIDFNPLDHDAPVQAPEGPHCREIATKLIEILLDRYGWRPIGSVEMLVDATHRGNAIGRSRQLRSNFSILRRAALQRKQAHDHLRAVQQSMIGSTFRPVARI